MPELPLEDVHRLLDTIGAVQSELSRMKVKAVQVSEMPDLSMVILEVLGWTNTAYMETKLGIDPSILSKFVKLRGTVPLHVARTVADRMRTYLKSQDQASPPPGKASPRKRPAPQKPPGASQNVRTVAVPGETWIAVRADSDIKMKIAAVASLLDSIIAQAAHSNLPPDDQILTSIEREQLIAVLETALNILRSPLVEKGLLKKTQGVLKRGAQSAAEKGVQQGLGKLMEGAAARIAEIISGIFG